MNCPYCGEQNCINEPESLYFVGRNSSGVPFYKCETCGKVFYHDEDSGRTGKIVRREKGKRFVPVSTGAVVWLSAILIFWIFGSNIITWIICGFLLFYGWSSIKIGIFGSQDLIDEMTLDSISTPTSKRAKNEWNRIMGNNDEDETT